MERVNVRRLPDDWSPGEEALLSALDDATATPISITRQLAEEWFDGVGWIIDDLEELVAKRPGVALELVEHLLLRLERALDAVDDSDGGMVVVLDRTVALHQRLAGDRHAARLQALGELELFA